jgi:hypothetical protein
MGLTETQARHVSADRLIEQAIPGGKEVLVAADRVVVRGEVTGTPAGETTGSPWGSFAPGRRSKPCPTAYRRC